MTAEKQELGGGIPSPRISEIVLRTSNFQAMKTWYQDVLNAAPAFQYQAPNGKPHGEGEVLNFHQLCFLRVHAEFPYTQVLALFEIPGLRANARKQTGLHHMQFRHASLQEWVSRYEYLRSRKILPYQSHNHGPSMSAYYEDPDGNFVELSGPNYSSDAEYKSFFQSKGFAKNPAGVEVNIEKFVSDFNSGVNHRDLVRLPD